MANVEIIQAVVKMFLTAYPLQSHEDVDVLRRVWLDVFDDIPDEPLQMAAREYLRSPAEWRPVPGKIRARALELAGRDAIQQARAIWDRTADISDDVMDREARERNDLIAREAIRSMRLKVRWHEDKEPAVFMAERERVFMETYARLLSRNQAFALPPNTKVPVLALDCGEEE